MLPTMCNINAFGTNNTVSGMAARHALSYFNNLLKEKALEKYKPTEVQNKKIVDNIQKIPHGDRKNRRGYPQQIKKLLNLQWKTVSQDDGTDVWYFYVRLGSQPCKHGALY